MPGREDVLEVVDLLTGEETAREEGHTGHGNLH